VKDKKPPGTPVMFFTAATAIALRSKIHEIRKPMSLRNGSHLPTTQCACADFVDFAKQYNGGGREKDLFEPPEEEFLFLDRFQFFIKDKVVIQFFTTKSDQK
jgi:hypothetical protein